MFHNIDTCLEKYIPQEELSHVQRILYGKKLQKLELPATCISNKDNVEVKGFKFDSLTEELREKR